MASLVLVLVLVLVFLRHVEDGDAYDYYDPTHYDSTYYDATNYDYDLRHVEDGVDCDRCVGVEMKRVARLIPSLHNAYTDTATY